MDSSVGYTCSVSFMTSETGGGGDSVRTSTYVLTNSNSGTSTTPEGSGRLPQTGDTLNLPLVVGLVLAGMLCVVIGLHRRSCGGDDA